MDLKRIASRVAILFQPPGPPKRFRDIEVQLDHSSDPSYPTMRVKAKYMDEQGQEHYIEIDISIEFDGRGLDTENVGTDPDTYEKLMEHPDNYEELLEATDKDQEVQDLYNSMHDPTTEQEKLWKDIWENDIDHTIDEILDAG